MGFVKEFKEFAVKGNVADMAIGIIIGAAFGKIVSSLVADVITPPLGLIIGGVDFSGLTVTLREAINGAPAVTLNYGKFIQSVFDFSIVAFAMFLVIKGMNALKRQDAAAPAEAPKPSGEEVLLAEIRDLLRDRPEAMKRVV